MSVAWSHADILNHPLVGLGLKDQPWRIVMKALDGLTHLTDIDLRGMSLLGQAGKTM